MKAYFRKLQKNSTTMNKNHNSGGGNMKNNWDQEVDYLVVGTGVAGMSAAITAKLNGLDTLIVESMEKWGGTTAISGGGLWVPNNPLMLRDGEQDSPEKAFDYLQATIGDVGPWTSEARKWAFINGIAPYINMLSDNGVKWARAKKYPDYYPDLPSGMVGRSIEPQPFNMRKLGTWGKLKREGGIPAPVRNDDVYLLSRAWSTPGGFLRGATFVFRTLAYYASGQKPVGMGASLASHLMYVGHVKLQIPIWLNSPITELILEDGRVVGAIVNKEGQVTRIRARRGVMLAAGGFAHNKKWRMKYQGVPGWSASPAGQLGQGIEVGQKAGGAIGMMEDSWWGATTLDPDGKDQTGFILNERSDPWSIVVDQVGNRYLNESESYVDFGHHLLEHNKKTDGKALPSWLVSDHRHDTHFLSAGLMLPGAKQKLMAKGELVEADTLAELAQKMGVDEQAFMATIERFNGFAKTGIDQDFERGRTVYDQYCGDPLVKPNPNLGPIEKGPFRAVKLYPGDLNTKGGLVTDEYARVVREDSTVIEGLYAAGNNTASVMGHTYPGPGASIAPAGVFGYIGALHASQQAQNPGHNDESHSPWGAQ
jgi:3-oxosteroid 1-dehydrogenase